jgi:hypothetical protein
MDQETPSPGQHVWIDVRERDGSPMTGVVERVSEPTSVARIVAIRLRNGRRTCVLLASRGTLWDTFRVLEEAPPPRPNAP